MKASKNLFEKLDDIKKCSFKEIERLLDENDGVIVNNTEELFDDLSTTIVINQTYNNYPYDDVHVKKVYFKNDEDGTRKIYLDVTYLYDETEQTLAITIDGVEEGYLPYLVSLLEDFIKSNGNK